MKIINIMVNNGWIKIKKIKTIMNGTIKTKIEINSFLEIL